MIEKAWNPDSVRDRILLGAVRQRRPLSGTLEVTCRCNFRCAMCYVRMSDARAKEFGRMRTPEEWLDMAGQMLDAGVLYLTLTGGECTLYPGFERLYEALCRMGFMVSVMSNAAAFTDAVRDVFRRYPPHSAGITLYGGSAETYAAVTGDPGGLDRALDNIRFLRSLGVPVSVNFTMIRRSALDYPLVSRLCGGLGLPLTLCTDITPHRYGPSFSDALQCRLSPAERAAVACHPPEEVALALENARELEKELAGFRMPAAPPEDLPPEQDTCVGAVTGCTILWNGEMYTCVSMAGYRRIDPFEIGFEAAWAQMKAEQEMTFRRPSACQVCSMAPDCLHNCAGRRFEGTGSPREPDPYTCQYTYLLRLYRAGRGRTDLPQAPGCT
ncbi:MAG: radical SAM protein [Clostridia bacterium]|nr:radical SAM protein [Clostridia bacterium]